MIWRRRDAPRPGQYGHFNTQLNYFGPVFIGDRTVGDPEFRLAELTACPEIPDNSSPSVLLAARHELVEFVGRKGDLRFLAEWLAGDPPRAALLVTGPGGQGKTRLALEAARRAQAAGWQVLVARHELDGARIGPAAEAVYRADKPARVLVLVDYADRWPDTDLQALFERPELSVSRRGERVRVLMLARSGRSWAIALRQTLDKNGIATLRRSLHPVDQAGNGDERPPSRQVLFRIAADKFADELGVKRRLIPRRPMLAGKEFELMLSVQMAALVSVLAVRERLPGSRRDRLVHEPAAASRFLILREAEHWAKMRKRTPDPVRLTTTDMARAVFLATLTRGLARDEAITLLDALDLGVLSPVILDDHRLCYPPLDAGHVLEPLYPDRLGEDFIAAMLPGASFDGDGDDDLADLADEAAPDILRRIFGLPGTSRRMPGPGPVTAWPHALVRPVITELVEVSLRWNHVASRYLLPEISGNPSLILAAGNTALGRLAEVPGADAVLPRVGTALDQVIGTGVNLDLDVGAVIIADRLAELARSRRDSGDLAYALRSLSIRQMAVGNGPAALANAEEAVSLGRSMAALDSPDAAGGLAGLTAALTNLAMMLAEQGQYDKALEAAREAVFRYRFVADRDNPDPAADLPVLGAALANLGRLLSDLGQHQEALDPTLAAVALYRQMTDPDEGSQITLAAALTNLAMLLSDLGRREEALDRAYEAVDLYRQLADQETGNPDASLPALAMALANLGGLLSDLGRHQDALAHAREAEELYRKITDAETGNPAYLPALSTALINVSRCRSDLGQHPEALGAAREAVEVSREVADLSTRDPAVSMAALATAQLNLVICLSDAGHYDQSLEASGEVISSYWQMAATSSGTRDVNLPGVAMALSDLGARLAGLGRNEEALQLLHEALRIARRQALSSAGDPAANLPGLAASLRNIAAILAGQGRDNEVLGPAEEAVSIYRRLTAADAGEPVAHLPGLAASLRIVSDARSRLAWPEGALEPAREAAAIYRDLAASESSQPAPFSVARASACHHLGLLLWELGQREEAIGPVREAIGIRRRLADSGSALSRARAATLAAALHNLGTILSELGRQQEACQEIQEAIGIRRWLTSPPSDDTAALLPDLADSLHNLAVVLSSLDQPEEALDPAEEAVFIYRRLTAETSPDPAFYRPSLADALRYYADRLHALGRTAEALNTIQEATSIYSDLVGDPKSADSARMSALAISLTAQALISQYDDLNAAIDVMGEAVEYWTALAERSPAQYMPVLTSALTALAGLRDRADSQEEVGSGREAGSQAEAARPAALPLACAIGIDLGTTNSVVAVLEGGEPTVITNAEGVCTTPSVVAFAKDGEVLVGEVAKRQAVTNVDRTIHSVKRRMGTTDWSVPIDGKMFIAQQISAFILQKLKRDAEAYLGGTVTDAVITVPAYFNDAQRQATKEAGQIAGLNVLRIINEPTSAALAYHLHQDRGATILVFDLGGGTFDVSLLEVGEDVVEVKATSGDNQLGGDDWDQRIVDWLVKDFKNNYGIDLSKDKAALQRLRETAEKTKIELSSSTESQINLPYITVSEHGPLHLDARLSRAEFQEMTADLLYRCRYPFQRVLEDARASLSDIGHVVMVGGSTRMPAVVDLVKELTGGKEPNRSVHPDEVVAVGACLQAGVLKGQLKDVLLLDVTPLSLGIETVDCIVDRPPTPGHTQTKPEAILTNFAKLIERNSRIPVRQSRVFTTAEDNQPSVLIQVFQGEGEITALNKKLGMFELAGIGPARRHVPQIEVAFDIDANGIIDVSAENLDTGKQQSVTISGGYTLSEKDIERMTVDAEKHADEHRKRREQAEARDHAETLSHVTEKALSDNASKVPGYITAEVSTAVAELKKALDGTDIDAIHTATDKAAQASLKMGMAIYAQTQRRADGTETRIPADPAGSDVEVQPRSSSQRTDDPEGHAGHSLQVICRTCGDRWDWEPRSVPADLRKLRGPDATAQARTTHARDRYQDGLPDPQSGADRQPGFPRSSAAVEAYPDPDPEGSDWTSDTAAGDPAQFPRQALNISKDWRPERMDPITLIVTALATGASAGAIEALKDDIKDAAKAAYARLHDLVQRRFRGNASAELILTEHQADPATYEAPLAKKLATAGAADDADLVAAAQSLMDLVDQTGARAGKYNVKIDNSEGVYVGDSGIQINRFGA